MARYFWALSSGIKHNDESFEEVFPQFSSGLQNGCPVGTATRICCALKSPLSGKANVGSTRSMFKAFWGVKCFEDILFA